MTLTIDYSLIQTAASDRDALERLIARVWPDAYRLAMGVLRDRSLAEDAAQEACASMAVWLASLKDAAAFRTWFYRLVVNAAITISRRRRETVTLQTAENESVEYDSTDALDLAAALQRLAPQQRAMVLLHYYAGLNSREIAEATGTPAATVRFHLLLARRALRRALSVSAQAARAEVFSNAH